MIEKQNAVCLKKDFDNSILKLTFGNTFSMIENNEWEQGYILKSEVNKALNAWKTLINKKNYIDNTLAKTLENITEFIDVFNQNQHETEEWFFVELTFENSDRSEYVNITYLPIK